MIELLAPVGNRDALVAAVNAGANAVYLAGKSFGARAYASNFTDEELTQAVKFAHLQGVSVYVTVNTLVDNAEISVLIGYLRRLYEIGVDAIITQDVGVAKIAHKVVPEMPLHASTQMTVHNLAGVEFLREYGFKRVVLARELSIDDIKHICHHTNVEIEVFVHGALCVCYSGQCLMSSLIGGRSGNRGRCAQPCRLPYQLVDENDKDRLQQSDCGNYLLSPRDLNTLELIPQLIEAGVTSFKIEGRMKRPEYVAVVVDAYRRAIDSYLQCDCSYKVSDQDKKDIAQIFNRDFTTAYLTSKQGRYMISDRRPNNRGVRVGRVISYDAQTKTARIKIEEPISVGDILEFWVKVGGRVSTTVVMLEQNHKTVEFAPAGSEISISVESMVRPNDRVFKVFDRKLMERARSFFTSQVSNRRIPLTVDIKVASGSPMKIVMVDGDGFQAQVETNFIAEQAKKRPLSADFIRQHIDRLGNTIFSLKEFVCDITGEVMVPVSEINDARRRAIEELETARLSKFTRPPLDHNSYITVNQILPKPLTNKPRIKPKLVVNVDTISKVKCALRNGADIIMFGGESYTKPAFTTRDYYTFLELVRNQGKTAVINTPRIMKEWQIGQVISELKKIAVANPDAVGIANIGTLRLVKELGGFAMHGDYPLNIYNSIAVDFFEEQGLSSLTLSPELNFSQIEDLVSRSKMSLECIVHGQLTLMISEYCMIGSYLGNLHNSQCNKACHIGRFWLKDRKNYKFPVFTDQFCRMHVLNAKELNMLSYVSKFSDIGVHRIRIEGKSCDTEQLDRITRLYRELLDEDEPAKKRRLEEFENSDITRGHYFRGVL